MVRTALTAATVLFCAASAQASTPDARAIMMDRSGAETGEVEIREAQGGLLFRVDVGGLTGWHGFHVHETGDCSGDFSGAGGHYSPDGNGHGYLSDDGPHAGDLPNIHGGDDGRALVDFYSGTLTLTGGDAPILDEDGSAIIIHENADTYMDEAGAGDRIACGVIEPAN
jgi:Cu-Zn family superoxide dismutase